jgi:hypothetical protein
MSTLILRPDADGSQTGWADEGGTYANVDDVTPDDDTTKLYAGGTSTRTFTFPDCGLTTETIDSITLHARVRGIDPVPSAYNTCVRISSTNYHNADKNSGSSTSYIDQSDVLTTNPATGLAWTISEVNALEAGVRRGSGGGQRITQYYVTVTYTAGGGGGGDTVKDMIGGGIIPFPRA